MLLIRLAALALILSLTGCAVRYDDAHRRRQLVCPAPEQDESANPPQVRFDDGVRLERRRARRLAGDPGLKPSIREQRTARALAVAQADMFATGQHNVTYGYDGSSSQIDKVRYIAQQGALRIDYEAAPSLNSVDGVPHALVLVVYHLSHTAAFDQLTRTEPGLRRLLSAETFDPSVKGVEQHFIQPGTDAKLLFNRCDEGRFVALVAGYALPKSSTSVFVSEYGLGRWTSPGQSSTEKRHYMYRPLPMHLAVRLDADSMSVRNTGLIHDSQQKLAQLMSRQMRYFTYDQTFSPPVIQK